ncbi:extracellular solute-binding protein [Alkaliphilus peptidifermentans]|uniref:ABC-type glycerol-3-phosphate transport system, substrate-binding protein n=1 Tax=Alkaliphilus peptidifermentans DSM 18978 TaxID=1120976 RepID=A0A1G5BKS2_9FIRM|nr:extracellular solute-binding protein [Alkaliphilus peptidifermentans]SCX90782.1 ABC-type glycerol-3-phosphate transport system, substrate-binding protein [Alkaliphilus peptidifermentans DSM 18978]
MKTKKLIIITLFVILLLLLLVLRGIWPTAEEQEENEIVILFPYSDTPMESYAFIETYRRQYEEETGVKVRIEKIRAGNPDKYTMKRNSMLYMKNGPTLLLLGPFDNAREFVEKGVALEITGKIQNQEKLYNGLKDDYYLPIKIHGRTISINRELLNKLNIPEPGLDWTLADHDYYWERALEAEDIYFNRNLFYQIVGMKIRDLTFIDEESNRALLNSNETKKVIEEIREEVFSGKYILEESYTYENYYRMFHELNSQESKDSWDKYMANSARFFIMNSVGHHYNGLTSIRMDNVFKHITTSLLVPDVRGNEIHSVGFVVNRNGKNVDLGLDFLNFLISDEIQFNIYEREAEWENATNAPVNKAIMSEVERIESNRGILEETLELRRFMTNRLDEGDYERVFYGLDSREVVIRNRFFNELIDIVFADEPYSDEELSRRLRKAENELTIYINE